MRVLKKKVQKEGIVKEIKRRQFYMKWWAMGRGG